MATNVFLIFVF